MGDTDILEHFSHPVLLTLVYYFCSLWSHAHKKYHVSGAYNTKTVGLFPSVFID